MNAIENLTATTLRNIIGEMELDQSLTSRDTINAKMRAILDEATDPWGIKVNRVELKNILPPREIQNAMEKQMKAERERRESILQAEGEKASKILVAEGEKQSAILKADAAKQARIMAAEAEAASIMKVQQALADAMRMLNENAPNDQVIKLKALEAFQKAADGKATKIIIPSEIQGLAGLAASAKTLLEDDKPEQNQLFPHNDRKTIEGTPAGASLFPSLPAETLSAACRRRSKKGARTFVRAPYALCHALTFSALLRLDETVAAVVAAIHHADIAGLHAAEYIEGVIQQVHLQNGLLGAHRLHGEVLGTHQMILRLLHHIELGRDIGGQSVGAQIPGQPGLVLADTAVDEGHRLVNGAPHIPVGVLLLRPKQRAVGGPDGQLHHAAVLFFYGEGHKGVCLLREVPIQLADLLLGIFLDGVVQRNFLTGKCELHVACSFPSVLCKRGEGSGRGFPLSLWALYHVAYCLKRCFAYFCG